MAPPAYAPPTPGRPAARGNRRLLAIGLAAIGFGITGCGPHPAAPFLALAAADITTIAVFGRGGVDMAVSLIKGRDCSVVYLEAGRRYCTPPEPPPPPQEFCARSLAGADCFINPAALNDNPRGLADGPSLNAAQERDRTSLWPKL